MSNLVSGIGEDLYRASFPFEHNEQGVVVGLWNEIANLAEARAKGNRDA
jgi:hypothetical protein